jgi:pyruvate dehydrogenase E1 component
VKKFNVSKEILDRICSRSHYLTTQMINIANHRPDKEKGDPKVGGHPAACASALHITGALHLIAKSGFDYIANKPHAAPVDHSYNYLMDLLFKGEPELLQRLSPEEAIQAMQGLRSFSHSGEPVFQSYHSAYDPDHHGFLPSGTVGIPPVNVAYLAHAYRYCQEHGYEAPNAHFWAICGDSEFREGSIYEAIPDIAEREIGNLTWILDYNRQSLDGHRITNRDIMGGTDDLRVERTLLANGWDVIQLRHGQKRLELFKRPDGDTFKKWLESDLQDYELQSLLLMDNADTLKAEIEKAHPQLKKFLAKVNSNDLLMALRDFGGHDILALAEAMLKSKENKRKPTLIIAHTLKGWGLRSAASPGNHSALPSEAEVEQLRLAQGLTGSTLFARFDKNTPEGKFLDARGAELTAQMKEHFELRDRNRAYFQKKLSEQGEIPNEFGINLKMASYPHTQWMLGQCTAKLTRISNSALENLTTEERPWKTPGELLVSMAPDVGTSTNLNPAMDGKIFAAISTPDWETDLGVKDKKTPDLVPGEDKSDRFLRFEIVEGNVMTCMGSYGKIREMLGIPLLPLMTVYDFFIKRAHDQYFYNLYWKSSYILVGTPAGITLSPEGAQHGWKSDFQIPNQITWEPFFCQELDWIIAESVRLHMLNANEGRTGVLIRGVTRGIEQRMLMQYLKRQVRFKVMANNQAQLHAAGFPVAGATDESSVGTLTETQILEALRQDVLSGAYYLVDYRGYAGYEPGDNVVNIFAMGSLTTEALKASDELLKRGIYANVIVVTSPDLLCGIQAHNDDYSLIKNRLGIDSSLHLNGVMSTGHAAEYFGTGSVAEIITLSGRRTPIVSVHDGEAGLLDNLGSIVGVRQEALAVRKHSRCGRPTDVYAYHHLDADSVVEACGKVLSETALENIKVSSQVVIQASKAANGANVASSSEQSSDSHSQMEHGHLANWRELWPPTVTHI